MEIKKVLEDGINSQVDAAKQLVLTCGQAVPEGRLEALEREIRAAFARATAEYASEVYDKESRITRFMGRKKWHLAKQEDPTITFVDHIRATYPDRHQFGMVRADLKDNRVDPKLYMVIAQWTLTQKDGSRNALPNDFGLPTKPQITDSILQSDEAATAGGTRSMLSASDARIIRARDAKVHREFRQRQKAEQSSPKLNPM